MKFANLRRKMWKLAISPIMSFRDNKTFSQISISISLYRKPPLPLCPMSLTLASAIDPSLFGHCCVATDSIPCGSRLLCCISVLRCHFFQTSMRMTFSSKPITTTSFSLLLCDPRCSAITSTTVYQFALSLLFHFHYLLVCSFGIESMLFFFTHLYTISRMYNLATYKL